MSIEEIITNLNLPSEVVPIITILSFTCTIVGALYEIHRMWTAAKGSVPTVSHVHGKDYLRVSSQLEKFGYQDLATKFCDLLKRDMIKKYARSVTGRYTPNWVIQLSQLILMLFLIPVFTILFNLAIVDIDGGFKCVLEFEYGLIVLALIVLAAFCLLTLSFDVNSLSQIPRYRVGYKRINEKRNIAPILTRNRVLEIAIENSGYHLVDARSLEEYQDSGLYGAITKQEFAKKAILYKELPVFVYSNYGKRSTDLVTYYRENGYSSNSAGIYNLGGIYPNAKLFQRLALELSLQFDT